MKTQILNLLNLLIKLVTSRKGVSRFWFSDKKQTKKSNNDNLLDFNLFSVKKGKKKKTFARETLGIGQERRR